MILNGSDYIFYSSPISDQVIYVSIGLIPIPNIGLVLIITHPPLPPLNLLLKYMYRQACMYGANDWL